MEVSNEYQEFLDATHYVTLPKVPMLLKSVVHAHVRHEKSGKVSMVKEYADQRQKRVPVTETEAFKRWFGDSKVVDKDGKPLMVHHGSQSPGFKEFRIGNSETGKGAFFTDDAFIAEDYAQGEIDFDEDVTGKHHDTAGIYSVYLRMENPMVVDAHGEEWFNVGMERLIKQAHAEKRDGIIMRNIKDNKHNRLATGTNYIVFNPNQIKSATGNRGTFDPHDADITKSLMKSRVKAHPMTTKSGKLAMVKEYERHLAHRGPATAEQVEEVRGYLNKMRETGHGLTGRNGKKYWQENGKTRWASRSGEEYRVADTAFLHANAVEGHWYAALHPEELTKEEHAEIRKQELPHLKKSVFVSAYARFLKTGKGVYVKPYEKDAEKKAEAPNPAIVALQKIPTDRLEHIRHKIGGLSHRTLTTMKHRGFKLINWLSFVDAELGRREATA